MTTSINCSICGRPCELVRREGKNGGTAYAKCGCGGMMMLSKKALAQFDAAQQKEPASETPPEKTDQKKNPETRTSIADDFVGNLRKWWNDER